MNRLDPRNRGVIEHFRPRAMTAENLRARFAATIPHHTPEQIEALVAKAILAIESKPHAPPPPLSQSLAEVADPLYRLGTHPDLVEELWRLDNVLPNSCRRVVWGYPALVRPDTGIIFAMAFGTIGIIARLPPDLRAQTSAVRRTNPGQSYDISPAGPEWRFLAYGQDDALCQAAYAFAGQ